MQKHRIRFNSDDDVRSQKSHFTNVSKIDSIPSKNAELTLEVELDDEVRSIIKHPEKCPSALLDVTVIKPKGLDQYTTKTQILKTEQVKKLIECMTLDNTDKKKLMQRLFGMDNLIGNDIKLKEPADQQKQKSKRKSCLSSKCKQIYRESSVTLEQGDIHCINDENNSTVFSMYNQFKPSAFNEQKYPIKESTKSQVQQIYTTPKTYENIRTMFACKNKEQENHVNDKIDQPCLCQNCAIVGILTDSQKKPFATEPMPDPTEEKESRYRRPSRKKSVSFKHFEDLSNSRSHDQCQAIFRLLSTRITELEKRVIMQEQKAVPKDYFKKIITKLVNHVSKLTHYTTEERNLTTSHRQKDVISSHNKYKSNDKYGKYYVNPVLVNNSYKMPAEKEYDPKPCSSSEPPRETTDNIWKWGEEFLTSGRDLKNKIVVLLEETLHNLKKGWEKPANSCRYNEEIQSVVDELSKNLANTVKTASTTTKNSNFTPVRLGKPKKSDISIVTGAANPRVSHEKKARKPSLIPRFKRKIDPAINVAYINPQLTRWPEESSVSFKIDTSDYELHKANMSEAKKNQYKREFLKVLENTKTTDKFKLWQNIWNQALENCQTKKDKVTIQIPDPKDLLRHKMIHLEYTIGELEQLLLKSQDQHGTR